MENKSLKENSLTTELYDMKKLISKGKTDAIETMKYLKNRDLSNPNYNFSYRITNENLFYLSKLNMCGKNVLSVGSSGDQYLESVLYNPSQIDLYDINVITYYYSILKIIGAKVLSHNDFIKFFMVGKFNKNNLYDGSNEFFDYSIYLKIRKYLPNDIKDYWDYLYQYESDRLFGTKGKGFFYTNYNLYECIGKLNYLKYDNYLRLQKLLEEMTLPNFYISNIKNLIDIVKQKYDVIITSNIDDYSNEPWFSFIREELKLLLTENGIIQTAYKWFDFQYCPVDFELWNFPSAQSVGKDSCLIYRNHI